MPIRSLSKSDEAFLKISVLVFAIITCCYYSFQKETRNRLTILEFLDEHKSDIDNHNLH